MLKPMNDLILLKDVTSQVEHKTQSGFILSSQGNPTQIYEVVEKGPTATVDVNIGDKVVLQKVTGQPISDPDGSHYFITRSDSILAIIED